MPSSAVRVTDASFAQHVENRKYQSSITPRKPVKREQHVTTHRPSVVALRDHSDLIFRQWLAHRHIRQIAANFSVPRSAVEDLLRQAVEELLRREAA